VPARKSQGYWKDLKNQKAFFDQLATKWNIQKLDDWHKATATMVKREGGGFISEHYNGSLQQGTCNHFIVKLTSSALQAVYPDYVPTGKFNGYWKDIKNQKAFFDKLAIKWNIQKPNDWNHVTWSMVIKEGGSFIINYYHGSLKRGTIYCNDYLTLPSITNNLPFTRLEIL
jgi:hypothetical protein